MATGFRHRLEGLNGDEWMAADFTPIFEAFYGHAVLGLRLDGLNGDEWMAADFTPILEAFYGHAVLGLRLEGLNGTNRGRLR